MFLLRAVVERLLAMVFGLFGITTLLQGLGILGALLVSFTIPGRSDLPPWVTTALIEGAVIGVILVAGGILLTSIRVRSALANAPSPDAGESLPREWMWPAAIPTLLLPAVAVALSGKLFLLWGEIASALHRLGAPADLMRDGGLGGLILLPIFAALFVPFLEALAALFLIAVPPFLLALLIARSHRFRMNCQRSMVAQATLVGTSLVGADLFARLADRAVPLLRTAEGPEGALVLGALARGHEVLTGTATAYAAVLACYGVSLWVLMAAHVPQGGEPEIESTKLSPSVDPIHSPVSELPQAPREGFEDVLARVRARRGSVASQTGPRSPGRAVLRVVLIGWGALLLGFGVWQLAGPHARYVSSSPAAGESLPRPPAAIVVRFSQALDPASSVSVQRTMGIAGAPEAAATPVVREAVLDPEDPDGKTLRAQSLPILGGGVYRVDWRIVTANRSDAGYGGFYFGIGMEVPKHLVGAAGRPYGERDARARRYRATLLGGVVLLILAALLPQRLLRG